MEFDLDIFDSKSYENLPTFDRRGLLRDVLAQLKIKQNGAHGTNHWARVRKHALTIGVAVGADLLVVVGFGVLR